MKKLLISLILTLVSTATFANNVNEAVNAIIKAGQQLNLQQAICDFRENYLRNMIEARRANISEDVVKYELYSLYAQDEIGAETLKEANDIRKIAYELPQVVIDNPDLSELELENIYLSCFKE